MYKLTREAPKIVSALAAMLIAIATTGCSTLMEPDHADAALINQIRACQLTIVTKTSARSPKQLAALVR